MEWSRAAWSVCLLLLIFPCTIKSTSSLLAPAHPGGLRKGAVKTVVCVCVLQHLAWKRKRPILISGLHKFVTYLLTQKLTTYLQPRDPHGAFPGEPWFSCSNCSGKECLGFRRLFLQCPSCRPTSHVKAPNETQSYDPNE